MDQAVFDSTDNLIIGVRGGRVFKCNATTGAVISSADYSPLAFGPSSIVWDSGLNRCFSTSWNIGHYNFDNTKDIAVRNIYRIVPTTLAVDIVKDIYSMFTPGDGAMMPPLLPGPACGFSAMRTSGGNIYATGWDGGAATGPEEVFFQISPDLTTVKNFIRMGSNAGSSFSPNNSMAVTGTRVFGVEVADAIYWWLDFSDLTYATFGLSDNLANLQGMIALEYAPIQNKIFVTDEFQFVYVFNPLFDPLTPDPLLATINTGRSLFNGVSIRYNTNDQHLYIAGGADNVVIVMNPANNTFVVKTGFDLPCDFVFTPAHKFAVQHGSTPLKEIV